MTDSSPEKPDPVEHEPASQRPEDTATHQTEQSPVAPNDPNSQRAQGIATQQTQEKQRELEERVRRGERWMIGLTGAIAFFGLCSVVVGFLQWRTMSGQLDEIRSGSNDTRTLAEAAKEQAAAAGKQAINMERLATAAAEQAKATQLSADQAKRAADIAEASLDSITSSARRDQRAWVGIQSVVHRDFSVGSRATVGLL